MKKLKDILYDYNDILIALAIMVIAALLIMWRISAIVEYPREFISDNTEVSEPAGENGFGYDPLFVPDGCDETFAQLSAEQKNRISHRAKALQKLERLLEERK